MIVYVASFPRCGNAWILQILLQRFGLLFTDLHGGQFKHKDTFRNVSKYASDKGYTISEEDLITQVGAFRSYHSQSQGSPKRLLLNPDLEESFEQQKVRHVMAKSSDCYVLKTHHQPYETYLPGEWVVQPIRHPGACLWSYYNFLRDVEQIDCSLETVIQGNVGFGSWNSYHKAWTAAAQKLNHRMLRVKYEALFGHQDDFCQTLSGMTGLPITSDQNPSFAEHHKLMPLLARRGLAHEWQECLNPDQIQLLNDHHADQMKELGYL